MASFASVNTTSRLHLRTPSKSLPAVVDIDAESSTSSSPSSPGHYACDTAEKSLFRSWQYPSSPDLSDDEKRIREERSRAAALERNNDESIKDTHRSETCHRGFHQASRVSMSRRLPPTINSKGQRCQVDHRPTASMPYGYQGAINTGASAAAVFRRGPTALLPYLFSNLRRARYNDLFFGLVFVGCLGTFLSALGGVGYSTNLPSASTSSLRAAGLAAGLHEAAKVATPELLTHIVPAPLKITPISPHGEKDDIHLFADVLPHQHIVPAKKAQHARAADQVVVDFSRLEADSAVAKMGEKPYVEPHDEGKPDLVADSPDDPRLDEEHADHEHHETRENIFRHGQDAEDGHDHGEQHQAAIPLISHQHASSRDDEASDTDGPDAEMVSTDPDATNQYGTEKVFAQPESTLDGDEYRQGLPVADVESSNIVDDVVGYRESAVDQEMRQHWNSEDEREVHEVEEITGRQNLRVRRLR